MATRPNVNQVAAGTPSEGDVIKSVSGVPTWGAGGGGGVAEAEISPTALSASVNDYAPTDWSTATVVRLSTNGSNFNITGFSSTATVKRKTLINVHATANITLVHQSTSSTAGNRINGPGADLVLGPGDICHVLLDSTTGVWRTY